MAVYQAIRDPLYVYIYDVADTFCARIIANKYTSIVQHICGILLNVNLLRNFYHCYQNDGLCCIRKRRDIERLSSSPLRTIPLLN